MNMMDMLIRRRGMMARHEVPIIDPRGTWVWDANTKTYANTYGCGMATDGETVAVITSFSASGLVIKYTSDKCKTWLTRTISVMYSTGNNAQICYGNGLWVIQVANRVLRSASISGDFVWVSTSEYNTSFLGYTSGYFYRVGVIDGNNVVYSSTDAQAWTKLWEADANSNNMGIAGDCFFVSYAYQREIKYFRNGVAYSFTSPAARFYNLYNAFLFDGKYYINGYYNDDGYVYYAYSSESPNAGYTSITRTPYFFTNGSVFVKGPWVVSFGGAEYGPASSSQNRLGYSKDGISFTLLSGNWSSITSVNNSRQVLYVESGMWIALSSSGIAYITG